MGGHRGPVVQRVAGTVSATNARSLLARSVFSATRHDDQPFGQGGGDLGEITVLAGRGVPQHRVGRGDGAFRLWLRKAAG